MELIFLQYREQLRLPRLHLHRLAALGGVIIPEYSTASLAILLGKIRADFGLPADEELTWRPRLGSALAALGPELFELRRRMLAEAKACGIRSVVVIRDVGPNQSKQDIAAESLKLFYDRVILHLRAKAAMSPGGCRGLICAGRPTSEKDGHWLAASLDLTRFGQDYVRPDLIALPIVTAPSAQLPQLQLADLVVSATTAAVAGYASGQHLVPYLHDLMVTDACGKRAGFGIVLRPQRLNNLYLRVFSESRCVAHGGLEVPLPSRGLSTTDHWPYATDDGLDPRLRL
ncbi:hypothetical protein [Amycolatopsis anabasis]|uniref:hypothetical protein n=1 Tax=Amycolatopsis anabasis TaxID=1840409 RepID=UPI00131B125F|nr:hypothetical protein [Amycolatopsis anabasis]